MDPKTADMVKKFKKARGKVFPDLWDSKDIDDYIQWFGDLAKSLSDEGLMAEASIVSQFWARTYAIFRDDTARLGKYLSRYFDKNHVGREK